MLPAQKKMAQRYLHRICWRLKARHSFFACNCTHLKFLHAVTYGKRAIATALNTVHLLSFMSRLCTYSVLALGAFLFAAPVIAQDAAHLALESEFGSFVEEDFPYFTQTVDAREFGEDAEPTNLTPRGIIVKAGNGYFGCFDPDLLRWSLIWKATDDGEYLSMDGMAPGSYRLPNRKSSAGQDSLPKPKGTPIYQSPALPGFHFGAPPKDKDPRIQEGADEGEVGLGPIPTELGRFSGIRLTEKGAQIEYDIRGYKVTEILESTGKISRTIEIDAPAEIDRISWSKHEGLTTRYTASKKEEASKTDPSKKRWPETVTLPTPPPATGGTSYLTFDTLPLPTKNPWKRNVRLSGFDFFSDGQAVICSFDGDVWLIDGLVEDSKELTWTRFASGLHEPMNVCIVDDVIYVSDRNGIVRLHDTDKNGEADWYENFSNIVGQTAETREFAMDMIATNEGTFLLAKGGQVGTTRGRHNGTVIEVAADGRSFEIIATGLRQPYIGYNSETGMITSSDQQGHWKPATPIYQIERGKYFGFQPAKFKDKAVHPATIDPPELWIPHFINQSGASQVWMNGSVNMGALNGDLIHIGYNRPELFKIYLSKTREQGAVFPLLSGFPAGILKGRINPNDGRLYVSGFEVWGTSGTEVSGLYRVRPTDQPCLIPSRIEATKRGILLVFDEELDPALTAEVGRYSADRWNYKQTHNYGSGNYMLDGEPGQESIPVASAMLSKDKKSLFLGIPDMQPSQSLRITYRLPRPDRLAVDSAYLTARALPSLDLTTAGFATNEVNLKIDPSLTVAAEKVEPTATIGKEVATRSGCIACHATGEGPAPASPATAEGGALVAVGPPWTGLWKSKRTFTDGSFIKSVDETYLKESILDPGRRVAEGFDTVKTGVGMPSYLGVLKGHEIDSIILYIKTLQKRKKKK